MQVDPLELTEEQPEVTEYFPVTETPEETVQEQMVLQEVTER